MTKQISVFLENKAGRLNNLLKILKENNVHILCLTICDTGEYGIARMVAAEHEDAMAAVAAGGMMASETEVIAVKSLDAPGGLYAVTQKLADEGINIEYLYSSVRSPQGEAVNVLKVSDLVKAEKVIIALNGAEVIYNI